MVTRPNEISPDQNARMEGLPIEDKTERMGKGPPRERLTRYREKRDFNKTPEPAPESSQIEEDKGKKKGSSGLEFVVQKHDATRLHYDVRLEINGALMSFAVPKGPSYDPKVRHLAVETEDHPMMY